MWLSNIIYKVQEVSNLEENKVIEYRPRDQLRYKYTYIIRLE